MDQAGADHLICNEGRRSPSNEILSTRANAYGLLGSRIAMATSVLGLAKRIVGEDGDGDVVLFAVVLERGVRGDRGDL